MGDVSLKRHTRANGAEKGKKMFNKHNFAIAKLANRDASRYAINGVFVCKDETVVTCGHQITRVSKVTDGDDYKLAGLATDVPLADEFKPFVMPVCDALEVAKRKPASKWSEKRIAIAAETADKPHCAVVVADNVQRAPKVDAQFPDYQRCIPKPETLTVSISFNAKLLGDILAAHAAMQDGVRLPVVTLRMKDGQSAFTIESSFEGQTMHSVVMPVRT